MDADLPICQDHMTRITVFCDSCMDGICWKCNLYNGHKGHQIFTLQHIFPKYQSVTMNEIFPKLQREQKDLENLQQSWKIYQQLIEKNSEIFKKTLSDWFNDVIRALRIKEKLLLDIVRKSTSQMASDCDKGVASVDKLKNKLEMLKLEAYHIAYSSKASSILGYKDLIKKLNSFEEKRDKCLKKKKEKVIVSDYKITNLETLMISVENLDIATVHINNDMKIGHINDGDFKAGSEDDDGIKSGYKHDSDVNMGQNDGGGIAKGHRKDDNITKEHRNDGDIAKRHRNDGDKTKEHRNDGDMAKGHRNDGDIVKGHRNDGDIAKGHRNDGDITKGHRNDGNIAKGHRNDGDNVLSQRRSKDSINSSEKSTNKDKDDNFSERTGKESCKSSQISSSKGDTKKENKCKTNSTRKRKMEDTMTAIKSKVARPTVVENTVRLNDNKPNPKVNVKENLKRSNTIKTDNNSLKLVIKVAKKGSVKEKLKRSKKKRERSKESENQMNGRNEKNDVERKMRYRRMYVDVDRAGEKSVGAEPTSEGYHRPSISYDDFDMFSSESFGNTDFILKENGYSLDTKRSSKSSDDLGQLPTHSKDTQNITVRNATETSGKYTCDKGSAVAKLKHTSNDLNATKYTDNEIFKGCAKLMESANENNGLETKARCYEQQKIRKSLKSVTTVIEEDLKTILICTEHQSLEKSQKSMESGIKTNGFATTPIEHHMLENFNKTLESVSSENGISHYPVGIVQNTSSVNSHRSASVDSLSESVISESCTCDFKSESTRSDINFNGTEPVIPEVETSTAISESIPSTAISESIASTASTESIPSTSKLQNNGSNSDNNVPNVLLNHHTSESTQSVSEMFINNLVSESAESVLYNTNSVSNTPRHSLRADANSRHTSTLDGDIHPSPKEISSQNKLPAENMKVLPILYTAVPMVTSEEGTMGKSSDGMVDINNNDEISEKDNVKLISQIKIEPFDERYGNGVTNKNIGIFKSKDEMFTTAEDTVSKEVFIKVEPVDKGYELAENMLLQIKTEPLNFLEYEEHFTGEKCGKDEDAFPQNDKDENECKSMSDFGNEKNMDDILDEKVKDEPNEKDQDVPQTEYHGGNGYSSMSDFELERELDDIQIEKVKDEPVENVQDVSGMQQFDLNLTVTVENEYHRQKMEEDTSMEFDKALKSSTTQTEVTSCETLYTQTEPVSCKSQTVQTEQVMVDNLTEDDIGVTEEKIETIIDLSASSRLGKSPALKQTVKVIIPESWDKVPIKSAITSRSAKLKSLIAQEEKNSIHSVSGNQNKTVKGQRSCVEKSEIAFDRLSRKCADSRNSIVKLSSKVAETKSKTKSNREKTMVDSQPSQACKVTLQCSDGCKSVEFVGKSPQGGNSKQKCINNTKPGMKDEQLPKNSKTQQGCIPGKTLSVNSNQKPGAHKETSGEIQTADLKVHNTNQSKSCNGSKQNLVKPNEQKPSGTRKSVPVNGNQKQPNRQQLKTTGLEQIRPEQNNPSPSRNAISDSSIPTRTLPVYTTASASNDTQITVAHGDEQHPVPVVTAVNLPVTQSTVEGDGLLPTPRQYHNPELNHPTNQAVGYITPFCYSYGSYTEVSEQYYPEDPSYGHMTDLSYHSGHLFYNTDHSMGLPNYNMGNHEQQAMVPEESLTAASDLTRVENQQNIKDSKNSGSQLEVITNHVVDFFKDENGSSLLRNILKKGTEREATCIFNEILDADEIIYLTKHEYGCQVIQALVTFGSLEQKQILVEQLQDKVVSLSLHEYGSKVIERVLDNQSLQLQILNELDGHFLKCALDAHGSHVIQKCIETTLPNELQLILDSFKNQVKTLAINPHGYHVIQKILEYQLTSIPWRTKPIREEILDNFRSLIQNQYGACVVRSLVEKSMTEEKTEIIKNLEGNVLSFSMNKFSSSVIDKCLTCLQPELTAVLIKEVCLMGDSAFRDMLTDKFASAILQKMLRISKPHQRKVLSLKIQTNIPVVSNGRIWEEILAEPTTIY